tara:strand:+ start:300 stop:500 length:201 start_codon:yes stop_codon:yes gene_type:complete
MLNGAKEILKIKVAAAVKVKVAAAVAKLKEDKTKDQRKMAVVASPKTLAFHLWPVGISKTCTLEGS